MNQFLIKMKQKIHIIFTGGGSHYPVTLAESTKLHEWLKQNEKLYSDYEIRTGNCNDIFVFLK